MGEYTDLAMVDAVIITAWVEEGAMEDDRIELLPVNLV